MLGFGYFTAFISIFLTDRFSFAQSTIGIYFGLVGLWMIFSQLVVVRVLSKMYDGKKILSWVLPVLAVVILAHPFITHEAFLYALMPLMAISFGLFNTNLPALVSKVTAKESQGAALGINGSLQALSQAMAPLAAGLFSGFLGLTTSFFIGAGLVASAFFVLRSKK